MEAHQAATQITRRFPPHVFGLRQKVESCTEVSASDEEALPTVKFQQLKQAKKLMDEWAAIVRLVMPEIEVVWFASKVARTASYKFPVL
jgi:hypothetical protein